MAIPDNVPDAIDANARGPKKVQVGNTSVEQHSVKDQIEADNHAAGKTAAGKVGFGLRSQRIVPPGAG